MFISTHHLSDLAHFKLVSPQSYLNTGFEEADVWYEAAVQDKYSPLVIHENIHTYQILKRRVINEVNSGSLDNKLIFEGSKGTKRLCNPPSIRGKQLASR